VVAGGVTSAWATPSLAIAAVAAVALPNAEEAAQMASLSELDCREKKRKLLDAFTTKVYHNSWTMTATTATRPADTTKSRGVDRKTRTSGAAATLEAPRRNRGTSR